ncbi:MAG TPA: hypothetical protein VMC85_05740 [Desulfomonilaceae bacterium]|nr:hypothetical protein [Desulfomonilaceae bacterium]
MLKLRVVERIRFEIWELDYECYREKRNDGVQVVDTSAVEASFSKGGQSIFFLDKGHFVKDGTYPGDPLARISAQPKRVSCGPGEDVALHVVVENLGDTVFNIASHPLGGFFTLGGHLRQGTTVVDNDLFHEPLPSDVECGGNCSLECTFRAPEISGDYVSGIGSCDRRRGMTRTAWV